MFTYPWVFALFFFFQKSHISIPNLVLRPSKSMPHALSISFPNINFLHSILYLFVYLSIGLFFLHTFVHGVLTSFLLTKFYPLFMPHFKFFLLYKIFYILAQYSPSSIPSDTVTVLLLLELIIHYLMRDLSILKLAS